MILWVVTCQTGACALYRLPRGSETIVQGKLESAPTYKDKLYTTPKYTLIEQSRFTWGGSTPETEAKLQYYRDVHNIRYIDIKLLLWYHYQNIHIMIALHACMVLRQKWLTQDESTVTLILNVSRYIHTPPPLPCSKVHGINVWSACTPMCLTT